MAQIQDVKKAMKSYQHAHSVVVILGADIAEQMLAEINEGIELCVRAGKFRYVYLFEEEFSKATPYDSSAHAVSYGLLRNTVINAIEKVLTTDGYTVRLTTQGLIEVDWSSADSKF